MHNCTDSDCHDKWQSVQILCRDVDNKDGLETAVEVVIFKEWKECKGNQSFISSGCSFGGSKPGMAKALLVAASLAAARAASFSSR